MKLEGLHEFLSTTKQVLFWQLAGNGERFWCRVVGDDGRATMPWLISSCARTGATAREDAIADGESTGLRRWKEPDYVVVISDRGQAGPVETRGNTPQENEAITDRLATQLNGDDAARRGG